MDSRMAIVLLCSLVFMGCISEEPAESPVVSLNESPEEVEKIPTKLYISLEESARVGQETDIIARLVESESGNPIAYKKIIFSGLENGTVTVETNASGEARIVSVFTTQGIHSIQAEFKGYGYYEPSKSIQEGIRIFYETCGDGTVVGVCSTQNAGLYCGLDKQLVKNCTLCSCKNGLVCFEEECISEADKEQRMFNSMMKSVVKISHSYASGSGVIWERIDTGNGTNTIILTNRHVVEEAIGVEDISVFPYEGRVFSVSDVRIAPEELDLAVVTVPGSFGAVIQTSHKYKVGDEVFAVGAPLGVESSVSRGVVSNRLSFYTDTYYYYPVIQTDAAINPGNSGGGLFLVENNSLIGIPSMKISAIPIEGMGFAIELSVLDKLPPYSEWDSLSPFPKCSDGTNYGNCSTTKMGYYCSEVGNLIAQCYRCGCAEDFECDLETHPGQCFSCPKGNTAYTDGTCCVPGTYWVGQGSCSMFGSASTEPGNPTIIDN